MEQILNSFIVRIDDKGNEVWKPVLTLDKKDESGLINPIREQQYGKALHIWNSTKQVIKLPTLIEFNLWAIHEN